MGVRARGGELVVFLRGVNVGGHRTFRPSLLAQKLRDFDVVNVGAAGTFVVRKPGRRERFCAALRRELPFEAVVVVCDGAELVRLARENPFGAEAAGADVVRFVSVLASGDGAGGSAHPVAKSSDKGGAPALPIQFPAEGEWLVRVVARRNQFVFGLYRRHMKTIGYLGQVDKLFGVPATTRNWNTILAVAKVVKQGTAR